MSRRSSIREGKSLVEKRLEIRDKQKKPDIDLKQFIGKKIDKQFNGIWYVGTITGISRYGVSPWLRVSYEDNDSEELNLKEVRKGIENYKINYPEEEIQSGITKKTPIIINSNIDRLTKEIANLNNQLIKIRNLNSNQRSVNVALLGILRDFYINIVQKKSGNIQEYINNYKDFTKRISTREWGNYRGQAGKYNINAYYSITPFICSIVTEIDNEIETIEQSVITQQATAEININTDLYNVFLENTFSPDNRTPDNILKHYFDMAQRYEPEQKDNKIVKEFSQILYIRDQIRWYVHYRQTFILDSIHDFGDKFDNGYFEILILEYRKEIDILIVNINILIKNKFKSKWEFNFENVFIKDFELINYYGQGNESTEDEDDVINLLTGKQSSFINEKTNKLYYTNTDGLITYLKGSTSVKIGTNLKLTKLNLITHMQYILNALNIKLKGTSDYDYTKISGIETIVAFNSGLTPYQLKNPQLNFIYGLDALGKKYKYPYTLQLTDRLDDLDIQSNPRVFVVNSTNVNNYDSGGSSTETIHYKEFSLNNNISFQEYFHFRDFGDSDTFFIHELMRYKIVKTPGNKKSELQLFKFNTSEYNNTPYTNPSDQSSITAVTQKLRNIPVNQFYNLNIQSTFMFKLLGDDSKSSFLYGIFTRQLNLDSQEITNYTVNYISNDITSSIKASIKLPGGLTMSATSNSNFIEDDKEANVEYIAQREWLSDWLKSNNVVDFTERSKLIAGYTPVGGILQFGKRIRSKNNKMPPKTNKKFIQSALSKMRKRGTLGSFKKWCIKNRLISKSGTVTKKCINLAKKSPNLKIRRKAIFAQNIKAYQGAKKGSKFGKKTTRKVLKNKIPKSLKKLAKKYSVRLTTKRGHKSVQQIKKQIKLRKIRK